MSWKRTACVGFAILLGARAVVHAQSTVHVIPKSEASPIVQTKFVMQPGPSPLPALPVGRVVYQPEGLSSEPSRQTQSGTVTEPAPSPEEPGLGPTLPENVKCLQ